MSLILLVACITGLIAVWLIPDGNRPRGTPAPTPQQALEKAPDAAAPDRPGPAPAGAPLILRARLLRREERDFFVECEIVDAEGNTLTRAEARWRQIAPR